MDSKILFDKIDNYFIRLRNSIRILGEIMSKTCLIVTTQDMPNVSSKLVSKDKHSIFVAVDALSRAFQLRQVNDNETDSKAD